MVSKLIKCHSGGGGQGSAFQCHLCAIRRFNSHPMERSRPYDIITVGCITVSQGVPSGSFVLEHGGKVFSLARHLGSCLVDLIRTIINNIIIVN